jgi:hypothetical protein
MPRGDGTGPMGMGPMTGRSAGYCNGATTPNSGNSLGFAGGFGCGYRNMLRVKGVPGWVRYGVRAHTEGDAAGYDERAFLSNQAEFLENQLKQVKKLLSSLSKGSE